MRRREFVGLVGGAAALPLAARAQQSAVPVIGFLHAGTEKGAGFQLRAFRQGLSETGFVEGKNVAIEYRWAEDQNSRLPALAADLVRRQMKVIVTGGGRLPVLAAKAATPTIPIVFVVGGNPVEQGLVASLSRPGGNVTGATILSVELGPKKLELLHELIPTATDIAVLLGPTSGGAGLQAAARALGLELHLLPVNSDRDIDTAFASLSKARAGGLVIDSDPFFSFRSEQLATLALRHAVPTIFEFRDFTAAGGLMSYGSTPLLAFRLIGTYTGRILKGEKPSDLPVQQATRIELIINMKTAKALGLTFPITLLGRADAVVE